MLNVVFELVLSYLQFASITLESNNNETYFPKEWSDPMYYMSLMNLNMNTVCDMLTSLRGTRTYFMIISVVIPLSIVFIGLLFLSKKRVVLWYFFTLAGLMGFCCGVFAKIISKSKIYHISQRRAELLMYSGGGVMVICLILLSLGCKGYCGNLSGNSDIKLDKTKLRKRETENFSCCLSLQRLCYVLFSVLIAMTFKYKASSVDKYTTTRFSLGVSITFFIIAFFFLVWMIMGFTRRGREAQWTISDVCLSVFLKALLLLMSSIYIPIGTTVFLIFNCQSFSCPKHYRLPDDGSLVVLSKSNKYPNCISCAIEPGQSCPSGVMGSVCDGNYGDRFGNDVSLSCQGIQTFFWPAAGLVTIMYLIGVPILFFRLISVGAKLLKSDFPIKEPIRNIGEDVDKFDARRWATKIRQANNSCVFLFEPFEYKYRFCRLFQILQKLIIVGTSLYTFRTDLLSPKIIAISCSLAVHVIVIVLLFIASPFIDRVNNWISKVMTVALVIICAVAIVLLYKYDVPPWVLTSLMVINFAVPTVSIVIGVIAHCRYINKQKNVIEEEEKARIIAEYNTDAVGRRRLVTLQQHARASVKVKRELEEEIDRMNQKQEDMDTHIDRTLLNIIRQYLMIGGVFGILALGGCMLGLWTKEIDTLLELAGDKLAPSTVTGQFGGYDSWDHFTSHCCCSVNRNYYELGVTIWKPPKGHYANNNVGYYPIVERWYCDNNKIVERPRMELYTNSTSGERYVKNGTAVRGLCHAKFDNNCKLIYDNGGNVKADCPSGYSNGVINLW